MKSSQIKFANADLKKIDFEVRPRSRFRFLFGIGFWLLALIITPFGAASILIAFLMGVALWFFSAGFYRIAFLGERVSLYVTQIFMNYFRLASRQFQDPLRIARDSRPPVLYLRSFNNDFKEDVVRWDLKTSEEILTSILNKIGPVLAVGRPDETRRGAFFLGAIRIYLGENWQSEVEKLMSISRLVVIESSFSEGLLWELNAVREKVKPEMVLISLLSSNENDRHVGRFLEIVSEVFSTTVRPRRDSVSFIYFGADWVCSTLSMPPAIRARSAREIRRAIMLILLDNGTISCKPNNAKENPDERWRREAEHPLTLGERPKPDKNWSIEIEAFERRLFEAKAKGPAGKKILIWTILVAILIAGIGGFRIYNRPDKKVVEALLNSASVCLQKKDYDCTFQNCNKMIEIDPSNPESFRCTAIAYANQDKYYEAVKSYDKVVELNATDLDAYYNRAVINFQWGVNYDRVIDDATQLIKLKPTSDRAYGLLGAAHFKKGDYDLAVTELSHAIRLNSGNTFHYFYRGNAYFAKQEYDRSIADYDRALVLDKKNFTAYSSRAIAYYLRPNPESKEADYFQAISDLNDAILANPDFANAYYQRASIYEKLGDLEMAEADRHEYERLKVKDADNK